MLLKEDRFPRFLRRDGVFADLVLVLLHPPAGHFEHETLSQDIQGVDDGQKSGSPLFLVMPSSSSAVMIGSDESA
ncbi:hypothetical protein CEXT_7361 [Caerostris extrusa]|uniref:Uncharacterized protein n=1 Tax=Caerostris extrusa TaxID=172846 RepID=A0AAV4VUR4_CAEEX|nr:hypothetical protein CEXT_7361 [Caerostris extrusa]